MDVDSAVAQHEFHCCMWSFSLASRNRKLMERDMYSIQVLNLKLGLRHAVVEAYGTMVMPYRLQNSCTVQKGAKNMRVLTFDAHVCIDKNCNGERFSSGEDPCNYLFHDGLCWWALMQSIINWEKYHLVRYEELQHWRVGALSETRMLAFATCGVS